MAEKSYNVLLLATSSQTRGGISYVVKNHRLWPFWDKYNVVWIETHRDKGAIVKFLYFVRGFVEYLYRVPTCDMVHIHLSEPPSAIRKSLFFAIAKLLRKKTVLHFHSFSEQTTLASKFSFLYRYLFSHADRVIVLSPSWKKMVNKRYNLGDKVTVLYNPCQEQSKQASIQKKKQILYAGTLNQRKGYADLLEAFSALPPQFGEWNLLFAGNGEIRKAREYAQKLKIEERVSFAGWVNGSEKDQIFRESAIFCLPSYAEGFPMAVLDAWSYGLPVITTPVGGLTDIIHNDEMALMFNPGDVVMLVQQLNRMIADESLRESLSRRSAAFAATEFSGVTINKQMEEIYDALLEG